MPGFLRLLAILKSCVIILCDYRRRVDAVDVLKFVFEHLDALEGMGDRACQEARSAGAASYYVDEGRSGEMLVEHPNGDVEPVFAEPLTTRIRSVK